MSSKGATDGYESDTGPRDIPTVEDLLEGWRVKKLVGPAGLKNTRALDRKGRAVVRIVHRKGLTKKEISKCFGVDRKCIHRAVNNSYVPPDDITQDEAFAGEQYTKMPSKNTSNTPQGSRAGSPSSLFSALSVSPAPGSDSSSGRKRSGDTVAQENSETAKRPRLERNAKNARRGEPRAEAGSSKTNVHQNTTEGRPLNTAAPSTSGASTAPNTALPPNSITLAAPHAPTTLAAFLRDVMHLNLSHHLPLLTDRGFNDMALLRTMATHWEDDHLRRMLRGLLTGTPEELKGRQGLSEVELWSLELAIRKLKGGA
ncbi:hypothetical protein C8R46DRAFT_1314036 [Mycena filopes]|nr:hypothetical protein C8R46DRAFT_1314036 [Mycena filopes]